MHFSCKQFAVICIICLHSLASLVLASEKMGANLFQINGKVLTVEGNVAENGLNVVVINSSNPQRVERDTTGALAGNGRYIVTFFDLNEPVARTGDVFEVNVIDKAGNLLGQKKQSLTEADIQAFSASIDVKLQPTSIGKIGANLFSVNGTIYTAEGSTAEKGLSVRVQNISKPELVQTDITGALARDGRYIVTFFNLANPVAEAGDVVEITILDKAGNLFAQKKQSLTEADVKAFGVTIDVKQEPTSPIVPKTFDSYHFTIDYNVAEGNVDQVYRPDLTRIVNETHPKYGKHPEHGKTHPEYVVVLAEALEKAYATYKQDSSKDPIGDGKNMKVEIKALSITKSGPTLGENIRIPNRIDIDNDMHPQDPAYPKDVDTVLNVLRTVAAHELFHKVQDKYLEPLTIFRVGDFFKEGTAEWAGDFVYDDINNYIRRINPTIAEQIIRSYPEAEFISLLYNSNQPLFDSSYNSVLFWKYLTEHYTKEGQTEAQVILELWAEIDPLDTEPKGLIQKVTGKTFETIFRDWIVANYAKDFPSVDRESSKYPQYRYRENQHGIRYGRLRVPEAHKVTLSPSQPFYQWSGDGVKVNAWAADYFEINLDPSLSNVRINFNGADEGVVDFKRNFIDVQILMIKEKDFDRPPISISVNFPDNDFTKMISKGSADKIVIIVGGADDGGDYTLSIKGEGSALSSPWDVNADGTVDVLDLALVGGQWGQSGANLSGDVNGDGRVDVSDLALVGSHFGERTIAAAPPAEMVPPVGEKNVPPNVERLRRALAKLEAMPHPSRGAEIARDFLRAWLVEITGSIVTKTKLLPNYPNPFNPETWIPYQLAQPADVTIRIFELQGRLVRTLRLGHQPAGYYLSQSSAAYWDGRNESGEQVASGVYIYQLVTPTFQQAKRLVILK